MKKLYICENPYVLYKAIIERMGDNQNSYSLILSDVVVNLRPMVPILRQSGLFDKVVFFPREPYEDYYSLLPRNYPASKVRSAFMQIKTSWLRILRQKGFKKVDFPFDIDFKQYDRIVCTEVSSVINGYLSMNHIEYAIAEHALLGYHTKVKKFDLLYCVLNVLDGLHVLNGLTTTSRFCKELIVNSTEGLARCVRHKKITVWNVEEHIRMLDSKQKDRIFQLYAEAYGLNIDLTKKYNLLLTNPLYSDGYLPSIEKQLEFYKDVIRDYFSNPILIKAHPRDAANYEKFYPDCIVVDQNISSEVLNFSEQLKLNIVLTVSSSSASAFAAKAEEIIVLKPELQMRTQE